MTKKRLVLFIACVMLFGLTVTGCSSKIMDLTLASTKNVDLSRMGEFKRSSETVTGTSTKLSSILLFSVSIGTIDMERAMDSALSKIPGAVALVDFTLKKRNLWFILFGLEQYVVTGAALVDPNIVALNDSDIALPEVVMFNESGDITERKEITFEEYNQYLASAKYKIKN